MGLSIPGYGIHGTNVPNSIGKAASHGCIRMAKADLEELYPQVSVGDTVELVGQRNEETAQLFSGSEKPAIAPAPQPTLTAATEPAPLAQPAADSFIAAAILARTSSALISVSAIAGVI
jgi:hypothetical protein